MSIKNLKDEVADEVATILASTFQIDIVETNTVPHASDPVITFPNLDAKRQGTKLIDTCVLYIDIRRSTELNLAHRGPTVAKLYSAFVRAMTRCARHHKGHVRGIIGDRVMVIFDKQHSFVNAVECALSMNSTAQYVINKHFRNGEISCGIGIDTGRMLATKTGVRRHGFEQHAYRSLVWLGRPANVASKLTDIANKPEESVKIPMVKGAFQQSVLGSLVWRDVYPTEFVRRLSMEGIGIGFNLKHADPTFRHMYVTEETFVTRPKTAPILMTEPVWVGYKAAQPSANSVINGWFQPVDISVPGYSGRIFGGDVHYTVFE